MEQKIRKQLISLLVENQHSFLSGEEMSRQLNCSRAAIWKHIQELKSKGYQIEARPRHGYRMIYRPDCLTPEELFYYLQTQTLGRKIRYFTSLPTTQAIAHQWAKEGAPEGALVIAEEQTSGKGRLGHHWYSPPYQGIWVSLILRPPISICEASHFTLLASLAVYQAIQQYGLPIQIKWPNDLLIEGKKICGILTELKGEQDQVDYLVLGIGLNVNHSTDDKLDQLNKPATFLSKECGKPIRRASLLATILYQCEQLYSLYLQQGFLPIKQDWEKMTKLIGKTILARTPQGKIKGVAEQLNHHGALVLRTDRGLKEIYSADIEW